MTPARAWWEASLATTPKRRAAIYRALRLPADDRRSLYAAAPFALLAADDRWWIAAITNPPPILDAPALLAWEPIGDVILLDPTDDTTALLGERGARLVTPATLQQRVRVFTDGRRFLRAWADQRVIWLEQRNATERDALYVPTEPDDGCMPGALAIGDLSKIRDWQALGASVITVDDPTTALAVNRSIMRAARLPRVEATPLEQAA